ncbi:sodium/calcium exchanger NCL-like [Juglans microcarpa x Juglans regia]|uniref:sodium/calcium exchanger NCL-like n=1 Tax=Juglans microcarpa x Juglans regia TaxID=2249226 RepID=UPI001B7F1A3C|nr:sodium/calcium exchanger NCL-like [Juglans microcarpa x Juglans regia]XP_040989761.1 sodium/calcium exchanger NCL-like [Juglans microcarpa x Juglans regia]
MSNRLIVSFFFLILLVVASPGHGRSIAHPQYLSSSTDLVSDGVHQLQGPPSLALNRSSASAESTCEQTYGFLPCTTTVLGNLFLIVVYGYLMFLSATYLSHGSELLLEILGPGIVGGLFLPVLGALPDAMLILVSGLSGSTAIAQSQVSVGMGLLAGSTVMLLTIIWGTCVIVGKCDLVDSVAQDAKDTKGFSLTESGVSTDIWTSYAATIMVLSVIPFLIVQIPQILDSTSGRHLAVLIALIVSLLLLVSYCLYQVVQPWIQKRKIAYVKHKHVILGLLRHLRQRALGRLLRDDGEPDRDVIEKLFTAIDVNGDGHVCPEELSALVVGIRFEEIDLDQDDAVIKVLQDFDTSRDSVIDKNEFFNGISRWIKRAKRTQVVKPDPGPHTMKFLNDFHEETKREHDLLDVGDQSDEVVEEDGGSRWTSIKAVLLLLLGTIIAAAFADPLVDAVDNFSDATSIPAFFISFIALPLATNSSEAVSAIIFASRDKRKTASLTFSELYGAATMNNVLCLSVFLALVYIRGLTWDFSSEVLVIVIVCVVVGGFASFRTHFPLWTALVAFLLYPFSLALIYVLDYILGWS